jgi:hypothetical protein
MRLGRTPDGVIHVVATRTSLMACGLRRFDVRIVYPPRAPTCLWCMAPSLAYRCGHPGATTADGPGRAGLQDDPDARSADCGTCRHNCRLHV